MNCPLPAKMKKIKLGESQVRCQKFQRYCRDSFYFAAMGCHRPESDLGLIQEDVLLDPG
jgi:hypothetical protein